VRGRRWTATITYTDNPVSFGLDAGYGETVQADLSEEDLQRAQAKAAYAEAATFLLNGIGEAAFVQLYKTTKNGTRKDHITYVIDRRDAGAWAMKKILTTK
jgi:phosphatidylserine/phosphatidylglycerophosphate/cardiolipin synthase-like enzyme